MYEISITWWKQKGAPDPDKTPWWTEPCASCPRLTPKEVFESVQRAYDEFFQAFRNDSEESLEKLRKSRRMENDDEWFIWMQELSQKEDGANKFIRPVVRFERLGDPPPVPFVEGVDRLFPKPISDGEIVPAMRLRYVNVFNYRGDSDSVSRRILSKLGFTVSFEPRLAELLDAVVYISDNCKNKSTGEDVYEWSLTFPDGEQIESTDKPTEQAVMSELENHMPTYLFKRAVTQGR